MEKEQIKDKGSFATLDLALIVDDLWRGLKRLGWIMIAFISIVSSYCYNKAKQSYYPTYEAYSSFVVNTQNAYGYSTTYYNKTTASQLSKTFPYILTSGALREVVAEDLGLPSVPAGISASSLEETALFTIKVNASDPQLAYDILQSVIKNYPIVAEYIIGDTQLILIDESGVPTNVINQPDFKSAAVKGFVLAAAICIAVLIIYALSRKTVRREQDLKQRLSISYLGNIPRIYLKKRSNETKQLILMDNRETSMVLGESFRTIRTRMIKEAQETDATSILVTSAIEGEGKSTIAANMAISLAKKGKKVILIDGDLRNPSQMTVLGMESIEKGIVNVLKGDIKLSEALVRYKELPLHVLGVANPISNPAPLISSENMDDLLKKAGELADYVIVDAPPCMIVSDTALLARKLKAALFVVRQDYASVNNIITGIKYLSDTGIKLLGYVINRSEVGLSGFGYRYSYGRYGYGKYGYGNEDMKSSKKK